MVMRRFCSSGSVSRMLVESSTLPSRFVAPTAWRRLSTRVVFPDPPCPTTATLRIFSGCMRANVALASACALIVFGAMSGHSKWSQIKRQKGAADVKKGVVFTKMTREIMLAAREGGGDPDANFRLRLAVDRARAVNMPHANIQRAIERATGGGDGAPLESIVYEGYAPGGVSVMVEAATDNRNRTASEVRAAFTKNGGKLGESGSVQWLFEQKGVIEIDAGKRSPDDVSLTAIDSGAEDVETDGSLVTAYTTPSAFEKVKKALETAGIAVASAEISMPSTTCRKSTRTSTSPTRSFSTPSRSTVLGIDPGTTGMGYALLSLDSDPARLIAHGLVPTPRLGSTAEKLLAIAEALDELIG